MLHHLGLAKKTLIYAHLLEALFSSTNKIAFRVPVGSCPLAQVSGVVTNVTPLGLDFFILC